MHFRCGAIFCLLALPLFTRCGAPSGAGHDIQAVELLHFNGRNETWAYRMDSVGRVQALHLDVDAPDSAVHCFTLSEPQRRRVLTLAQEVVRLDSIGTAGIRITPTDGAIAKVVVYRTGKPLFSYCNHPVPEYADPTAIALSLGTGAARGGRVAPEAVAVCRGLLCAGAGPRPGRPLPFSAPRHAPSRHHSGVTRQFL
jgi:hypothetical protein